MKVALIHGWGVGPAIWDSFSRGQELDRFDFCPYQLPGYGSRIADLHPDSIDELASDALNHITESCIWIGWSLGAMIAIAAASQNSKNIAGLFLVCPTVQFCDGRGEAPIDALAKSVTADPVKAIRRFGLSLPAMKNRVLLKPQIAKIATAAPNGEVLLAGLEILRKTDLSQDAARLDLPVHVIAGSEDQIVSPAHSHKVCSLIRGSELSELPCGHLPFLECPNLFVEKLVEFAETTAQ